MIKHYITSYSISKAETIINESDVDGVFESIYITIIPNTQKSVGKDSGLIIDSVIEHNISKSNLLPGSSYLKLPKGSDKSKKSFD